MIDMRPSPASGLITPGGTGSEEKLRRKPSRQSRECFIRFKRCIRRYSQGPPWRRAHRARPPRHRLVADLSAPQTLQRSRLSPFSTPAYPPITPFLRHIAEEHSFRRIRTDLQSGTTVRSWRPELSSVTPTLAMILRQLRLERAGTTMFWSQSTIKTSTTKAFLARSRQLLAPHQM